MIRVRSPVTRVPPLFCIIPVLALCLMVGCASLPASPMAGLPQRDQIEAFSLQGRFSLRQDERSHSGRLSWQHGEDGDRVLLASPFGQGLAELSIGPHGATLRSSDGALHSAADAESLTRQVLGYPLPIRRLADWIRARIAPADNPSLDRFSRPERLNSDGWQIEYGYDSEDPQALPARIFALGAEGVELRLRIDEWNPIDTGAVHP